MFELKLFIMAHFQPMDLYYAQWQFADKSAKNAKDAGNEKDHKVWEAEADEIWKRREENKRHSTKEGAKL